MDIIGFGDYTFLREEGVENGVRYSTTGDSFDSFIGAGTEAILRPSPRFELNVSASTSWRLVNHSEGRLSGNEAHEIAAYTGSTIQAGGGLHVQNILFESDRRDVVSTFSLLSGLEYQYSEDDRVIRNTPVLWPPGANPDLVSNWIFPDFLPVLDYSTSDPPFAASSASRKEQQHRILMYTGFDFSSDLYPDLRVDFGFRGQEAVLDTYRPVFSTVASYAFPWADGSVSFASAPLVPEVDEVNIALFEESLQGRSGTPQGDARSFSSALDLMRSLSRWDIGLSLRGAYYMNLSGYSPMFAYERVFTEFFDEDIPDPEWLGYVDSEIVAHALQAGRYGLADVSLMYRGDRARVMWRYSMSSTQFKAKGIPWTRSNNDIRHRMLVSLNNTAQTGFSYGVNTGIAWDRPFTPQVVSSRIMTETYEEYLTELRDGVPPDAQDIFGRKSLAYNSATDLHPYLTFDLAVGYYRQLQHAALQFFLETVNLAAVFNPVFNGDIKSSRYREGADSSIYQYRNYTYAGKALFVGTTMGLSITF